MQSVHRSLHRGLAAVHVAAADREEWIWLLVLTALTADIYLTYIGLRAGLTEANPVMRSLIQGAGFAMLGLVKVLVFGTAGLLRDALPDHGPVISIGLAIPWTMTVLINILMLSSLS